MTSNTDHVSLPLNQDQAAFKQMVLECISLLPKYDKKVSMLCYNGTGYSYSDFVITLKVSRDRRSCELWRNRTGTLIFAMNDMETTAMNWQYIFLETHLKTKLKENNG